MPNITISGLGKIDEGKYDKVLVNGSASCDGELQAAETRINGALRCSGAVKSDFFICNGTARLSSGMDIKELHCSGSIISDGVEPVTAKQVYCGGALKFSSDVKVDTIDVDGSLHLTSDCNLEADKIFCDGTVIVNGNINANLLNSDGFVYAETISADKIYIRTKISAPSKKVFIRRAGAIIGEIKGDDIELIGVKALRVVGKNITIGDRCAINSVECSGKLHISEKADVKEITGNYTTV